MPAVKQTGTLMAALGAKVLTVKKAHEEAKAAPISWGMQNLPPGVRGGIAELKTATWNKYAADAKNPHLRGQPYVLLRGVALSPKEHNGCPVEGLSVMQNIALCDQPDRKGPSGEPKTIGDAWAELLNEIKKFGIDTSETTPDHIEGILANLESADPPLQFRFSTRGFTPKPTKERPNPNEMVFVDFDGLYEPGENGQAAATDAVEDGSPEATGESAADPNADGALDDQLPVLAEAADGGDDSAIATLTQIVKNAGWTDEQAMSLDTWAEVVGMLAANEQPGEPAEGQEPAEATPPAPVEPTKGSVWQYAVLDAKTKKPVTDPKTKKVKPPVQVEIKLVDKKNKTVTALNLVDRKTTYLLVPWASLIPNA